VVSADASRGSPPGIYRLGGCSIRSPVPLPNLPLLAGLPPETCDIQIDRVDFEDWGSGADGDFLWTQDEGQPDGPPKRGTRRWSRLTPEGRIYRYRFDYFEHAAEFLFLSDGSRIRAGWTDGVSDGDVAVLLQGPVLGRALRLRGVHCLHGTTVTIDGRALSFLGPSRAGKSSFAAALVRSGCELLSDDQTTVVCRDSRFFTLPGQPGIRLWVDSAQQLATGELRRIWRGIDDLDKFVADVPSAGGSGEPDGSVPVGGLYLIGRRNRDSSAVEVSSLPLPQRVAVLCASVYGGMEPAPEVRARELAFFARMAAAIPVGGLRLPHGLGLIEAAARDFLARVRAEAA
jgi:hypothetical protein